MWSVKVIEEAFDTDLTWLGIYPHKMTGLIGVITAPLVHADFKHLTSNSVPMLILGVGLFYFYRGIAYRVFFLSYFITGFLVWFGAREAYHIGASGVVYGLASFIFFSGIIRRDPKLMAVSLMVIFLYGSMIWGIFPFIPDISWESHLSGGISGFLLTIYFRHLGPQRDSFNWEDDEDNPEEYEFEKPEEKIKDETTINYFYTGKKTLLE